MKPELLDHHILEEDALAMAEGPKMSFVNNNNNNSNTLPTRKLEQRSSQSDSKPAPKASLSRRDCFERNVQKRDYWMEMYERLVAYQKKYKNTRVPYSYKADPKLRIWVFTQRQACKEHNQFDLLNAIGFEWRFIRETSEWGAMYQRLLTYKKKHGTTCVPSTYKADTQLVNWVHNQRRSCKEKDRIDLLNDIGFVWNVSNHWEDMYQRLLMYKKKHGTTRVASTYKADPKLANWVKTQRQNCEENYRSDMLKAIGFEWKLQERNDWGVMYQRLLMYKKKHGTASVPTRYKADRQLATWVTSQRSYCKKKDRIDLLNNIGFAWKVHRHWGVMYQRLLTYKENHGNTRVPRHYKADLQFAHWVYTQRHSCKKKDRIDLLNDIGFVWNPKRCFDIDTEDFIII